MTTGVANAYDAGEASFFIEKLSGKADLVYRLGFALTLSEPAASDVVMAAYKACLADINKMHNEDSLMLSLRFLRQAWLFFKEEDKSIQPNLQNQDYWLAQLPVDCRAAVTLVDIIGLSAKEAAMVIGTDEGVFRGFLSKARQAMIKAEDQ